MTQGESLQGHIMKVKQRAAGFFQDGYKKVLKFFLSLLLKFLLTFYIYFLKFVTVLCEVLKFRSESEVAQRPLPSGKIRGYIYHGETAPPPGPPSHVNYRDPLSWDWES